MTQQTCPTVTVVRDGQSVDINVSDRKPDDVEPGAEKTKTKQTKK